MYTPTYRGFDEWYLIRFFVCKFLPASRLWGVLFAARCSLLPVARRVGYAFGDGDYFNHTFPTDCKGGPSYNKHNVKNAPCNGTCAIDFNHNNGTHFSSLNLSGHDFGVYSANIFGSEAERLIQQHDVNLASWRRQRGALSHAEVDSGIVSVWLGCIAHANAKL